VLDRSPAEHQAHVSSRHGDAFRGQHIPVYREPLDRS
jgi:hypothetical protein